MKTVDRYMTRRLAFAAVLSTVGLSGPIILVSLMNHLPIFSVSSALLWPALYGIGCMILFHTIPILVAGTIIWIYGQFLAEGVLVTLYMAGRSTFAVKLPAFVVGLVAVAAGYALSLHYAPDSARFVHDVLFALRRDMNPDLLEAGKFNPFGRDGQVFFFERKVDGDRVAKVFIRQVDTDGQPQPLQEKVYTADHAIFGGVQGERWVALVDGSVVISKRGADTLRRVHFTQLKWRPVAEGEALTRGYNFFDEMTTAEFWGARAEAFERSKSSREWAKEAVKRFALPLLALAHTMLGLELLTLFGLMTDRHGYFAAFLVGAVISLHLAIVLATEAIGKVDTAFAFVALAMIVVEIGLAVTLMLGGGRRFVQDLAWKLSPPYPWARGVLALFLPGIAADPSSGRAS
ncbi:MAG TPA: LptF/LptG family permease [Hyphomicrobiales bacterium]|nr:LptF/LptG family permease [Hyphomicrobiales bacterium]